MDTGYGRNNFILTEMAPIEFSFYVFKKMFQSFITIISVRASL